MRTTLIFGAFFLLSTAGRAQTGDAAARCDVVELTDELFSAVAIHFETGQSSVHPSARRTLDAVAAVLMQCPQLRVELAGHTDAVGSPTSNVLIARQRAESVREYLVTRHGIDRDRLDVIGLGESFPLAGNQDHFGRMMNRRVELRVLTPSAPPAPNPEITSPSQEQVVVDEPDLQELVEQAVRSALEQSAVRPDTSSQEELPDRLDEIEKSAEMQAVSAPQQSATPTFALLPLTGFYLAADLPVIIGVRADIPTSLFGRSSFQPEAAVAFTPKHTATLVNVNLTIPIRLSPRVAPFLGAGIGFQNIDAFESVLNVMVGSMHRFDFGVLFAEIMTQDFGDFNRVVVGYRQEF